MVWWPAAPTLPVSVSAVCVVCYVALTRSGVQSQETNTGTKPDAAPARRAASADVACLSIVYLYQEGT